MFRRLTSYLRNREFRVDTPHGHGFRSPQDFSQVLEIERHRADRANGVFSLLIFSPREGAFDEAIYAPLASILRRRLRQVDQTGWLDKRRIGVMFPNTPASGAWMVADDVCLQFPAGITPPNCTVLTYPGAQIPPEDDGDRAEPQPSTTNKPVEAMDPMFVAAPPAWKRALDVMGASVGLTLLLPLLLAVAAALKATSRGPVLFSQWRTGEGGKRFRIFKFRSMVVDADVRKRDLMAINEQDGPAFKVKNDPRVTRIGRILRKTSIDELPQLWNVLRGEMSLVGPRPLPCDETDACDQWQRRRLDVRPGLTCIWQVKGRSKVAFDDWMRMDVEYIRQRSLYQDLSLILRTFGAVLGRSGC